MKAVLILFIHSLLFLFFTSFVEAGTPIDFKVSPPAIPQNGEVSILFNKTENFRVRPLSAESNVQIWDASHRVWKTETSNWLELPLQTQEMRVRFPPSKSALRRIGFLLQDQQYSEIVSVSPKYLWFQPFVSDYITRINHNILGFPKNAELLWKW